MYSGLQPVSVSPHHQLCLSLCVLGELGGGRWLCGGQDLVVSEVHLCLVYITPSPLRHYVRRRDYTSTGGGGCLAPCLLALQTPGWSQARAMSASRLPVLLTTPSRARLSLVPQHYQCRDTTARARLDQADQARQPGRVQQ